MISTSVQDSSKCCSVRDIRHLHKWCRVIWRYFNTASFFSNWRYSKNTASFFPNWRYFFWKKYRQMTRSQNVDLSALLQRFYDFHVYIFFQTFIFFFRIWYIFCIANFAWTALLRPIIFMVQIYGYLYCLWHKNENCNPRVLCYKAGYWTDRPELLLRVEINFFSTHKF